MPSPGDRGGAALAVQGRPSTVDERSTLSVAKSAPSLASTPDRGLSAGVHSSRDSKRRATADEAKSPRPERPRRGRRSRRQGKET